MQVKKEIFLFLSCFDFIVLFLAGRTIVHFKNGTAAPSWNAHTKLYVKPSWELLLRSHHGPNSDVPSSQDTHPLGEGLQLPTQTWARQTHEFCSPEIWGLRAVCSDLKVDRHQGADSWSSRDLVLTGLTSCTGWPVVWVIRKQKACDGMSE